MTFSYGQDFYTNLLKFSGQDSNNDEKAIEIAYELQSRLQNYWKNNSFESLKKSENYSGNVDLNGNKSALGGDVNPFISGINNAPGTPADAPEFPFWSLNNKGNLINNTKVEEKKTTESEKHVNFNDMKEHLTDSNGSNGTNNGSYIWIMLIIIIFIFSIILGCCAINKN